MSISPEISQRVRATKERVMSEATTSAIFSLIERVSALEQSPDGDRTADAIRALAEAIRYHADALNPQLKTKMNVAEDDTGQGEVP